MVSITNGPFYSACWLAVSLYIIYYSSNIYFLMGPHRGEIGCADMLPAPGQSVDCGEELAALMFKETIANETGLDIVHLYRQEVGMGVRIFPVFLVKASVACRDETLCKARSSWIKVAHENIHETHGEAMARCSFFRSILKVKDVILNQTTSLVDIASTPFYLDDEDTRACAAFVLNGFTTREAALGSRSVDFTRIGSSCEQQRVHPVARDNTIYVQRFVIGILLFGTIYTIVCFLKQYLKFYFGIYQSIILCSGFLFVWYAISGMEFVDSKHSENQSAHFFLYLLEYATGAFLFCGLILLCRENYNVEEDFSKNRQRDISKV